MKDTVRKCRRCGTPICVISCGMYRNVLVDAEAVAVIPDMCGECFIRVDGSKMRGREVVMSLEDTKQDVKSEYVYRPHAKTCGIEL